MTSLGTEYPVQQKRCQQLLLDYKNLPNNAGVFGATMIEQVLQRADKALASNDITEMIKSYDEMINCK